MSIGWDSLDCFLQMSVCVGVLGTQFGSLELKIGSLKSYKFIIGFPE